VRKTGEIKGRSDGLKIRLKCTRSYTSEVGKKAATRRRRAGMVDVKREVERREYGHRETTQTLSVSLFLLPRDIHYV